MGRARADHARLTSRTTPVRQRPGRTGRCGVASKPRRTGPVRSALFRGRAGRHGPLGTVATVWRAAG
jgi:hypothetical protein